MSDKSEFDLENFRATEEGQTEIPVCVPTGPFRVRPGMDRSIEAVFVSRHNDQWWLVSADVESRFRVPRLWKADLYEAVRADGSYFILPITHPRPGCEDYYDTLQEARQRARKEWVIAESDRDQKCYHISTATRKNLSPPEWLECDFAKLVEAAFEGRIIHTVKDAERCFGKRASRRVLDEECVD